MKFFRSQPTIEGAGVRLNRVFGFNQVPDFDPFLLLDDFSSENPEDYLAGFPWHPHRGIETVTYIIEGEVEHGDSLGNKGNIRSGDCQWMTAGSGIIHQEMPRRYDGEMRGFQLWVNLPRDSKMCQPKYRDVEKNMIQTVSLSDGINAKVICGDMKGVRGPVEDLAVMVDYFDYDLPPNTVSTIDVKKEHKAFVYIHKGNGFLNAEPVKRGVAVLFDKEYSFQIESDSSVGMLYVSGIPLKEPVAWQGPIVMNTEEELALAFKEYSQGSFIKHM